MAKKPQRARRPAQPGARPPKKNLLASLGVSAVDYKDTAALRLFISERGKIRSRQVTGLTVQQQRRSAPRSRTRVKWRYCRIPDRLAAAETCCAPRDTSKADRKDWTMTPAGSDLGEADQATAR